MYQSDHRDSDLDGSKGGWDAAVDEVDALVSCAPRALLEEGMKANMAPLPESVLLL